MQTISTEAWTAFRIAQTETTFEPIYDATRRLVFTICYRILGDEETALDALQATYARLLLHARNPEPGLPEGDEIGRLACRLAVREAQSLQKRRNRRSRREIVMEELPMVADASTSPARHAQTNEIRSQLETLIRVLPEKERLPIQLHYLHGLTQLEVAEALAVDRSTVARRLGAGLKRLQRLATRAGLGDVASSLAALATGAALLEPAQAVAIGFVLAQAQALAAAGGATTMGASFAGWFTHLFSGGIAKTVTVTCIAVIGVTGLLYRARQKTTVQASGIAAQIAPGQTAAQTDASSKTERFRAEFGQTNTPRRGAPASTTTTPSDSSAPLNTSSRTPFNVRLVDARTKAPVADVSVHAGIDKSQGQSFYGGAERSHPEKLVDLQSVVTDGDGLARFTESTTKSTIIVQRAGRSNTSIPPNERPAYQDKTGLVTIPLSSVATVEGTVYAKGEPASSATLRAYQPQIGPDEGINVKFASDLKGRFKLDGFTSGPLTLSIVGNWGGDVELDVLLKDVKIVDGENASINLGDNLGDGALYGQIAAEDGSATRSLIALYTTFNWEYKAFGSLSEPDGTYKILGLKPGRYQALIRPFHSWKTARPIKSFVEVNGMTLRDFEFKSSHRVTARLRFPPHLPPAFASLRWNAVLRPEKHIGGPNPDQLDTQTAAKVEDNRVLLAGRFKGNYKLEVSTRDQGADISAVWPLSLDTTSHDADLGELDLPIGGVARLELNFKGAEARSKFAQLRIVSGQPKGPTITVRVDPTKREQLVEALPLGSGEVSLWCAGSYRVEPERLPIKIAFGNPVPVQFTVTPTYTLEGWIENYKQGKDESAWARITIKGGGVEQTLIAGPMSDRKDGDQPKFWAVGTMFNFNELPIADYELTIEAKGYEPLRESIKAMPGKAETRQFPLKKLP